MEEKIKTRLIDSTHEYSARSHHHDSMDDAIAIDTAVKNNTVVKNNAVAKNNKAISKSKKNKTDDVKGLYTWLLKKLFNYCGHPPIKMTLWNGEAISGSDHPHYAIHIKSKQALQKLITHPDLYFGDLYTNGSVKIDGDLVGLLETIYIAQHRAKPVSKLHKLVQDRLARPQKNTLENSRSNIHQHYNIGNDFYSLWLCENMQYTCAYYQSLEDTLEQAQINKMEHICRKLQLEPGQSVVEAGCGWGGLARYMAKSHGVKVTSYNISEEQIKYARGKIKEQGLEGQVEYVLDDYRNARGKFDAFVSVGMLEHVGTDYYDELGGVIDRCLKDEGSALLHFIGRNKPMPMNAWIEKRIFPGAHPPSLSEIIPLFENWGFSVLDIENIRLHYSKTLHHWLERYEKNIDSVIKMYDEPFARAWRLYLAGSIAAFDMGDLQLFQILFNKAANNRIPLTREHLYTGQPAKYTWTDTTS
jgi:cyclopropane-fatty-acyl-phospholipid synthase